MKFGKIRREATFIHASDGGKVTLLHPSPDDQEMDKKFENLPYSARDLLGDGSHANPRRLGIATKRSPHYLVIALWFQFHQPGCEICIQVNDWKFKTTDEGVVAEDGHFTKLS